MEEDHRAVLVPHVRTLAVQRGRVVHVPEGVEQLFVGHPAGVECDLDRLRVARASHADLLVRRMVDVPSRVTRDGVGDARNLIEEMLDSPEASAGERGFLHFTLQDNSDRSWFPKVTIR